MQETSSNLGSNLDWFSLSLKPVQKLPQLKMLLERLLKKTPKDHPDRFAGWNCRENHMNLVQVGSAGEHTGFGEASGGINIFHSINLFLHRWGSMRHEEIRKRREGGSF